MTSTPNPEAQPKRPRPASTAEGDRAARRSFVRVAVTLTAVIVILTGALVLVTVLLDPPAPRPGSVAHNQAPALDLPDAGQPPTRPGDRGGWEQLALLGMLCVVFAGGAAYLVSSSRRARRRKDAASERAAYSIVESVGEEREHRLLDDRGRTGGREPPM